MAEHDGFLLGVGDAPAAPGCEHTGGVVECVLLPSDCNHLDLPAGPAEFLPKAAEGSSPGVQLGMGSHAGVDAGGGGPSGLNGNGNLDVIIADLPVCAAGMDSLWKRRGTILASSMNSAR